MSAFLRKAFRHQPTFCFLDLTTPSPRLPLGDHYSATRARKEPECVRVNTFLLTAKMATIE